MKKKTLVVLGVAMLIGTISAAAWDRIPGVNCPYDESAFYSPTTPDYADSPSIYGESYLAAHGMDVYDPKRHEESKKYGKDLADILNLIKHGTLLKELNHLSLGNNEQQRNQQAIFATDDVTKHLFSEGLIDRVQQKKIFRDGTISNYQPDSLKKEQLQLLSRAYMEIAQDAKTNLDDLQLRTAALDEAVRNSVNAQGYMQAEQAKNQINALREAEELRYNALLNDYMNLMFLEELKAEDEDNRRFVNRPVYRMADPYNITDIDKVLYPKIEREKAHFVDF